MGIKKEPMKIIVFAYNFIGVYDKCGWKKYNYLKVGELL